MRTVRVLRMLAAALAGMALSVQADTLAQCAASEHGEAAMHACVEAERNRSFNQLRQESLRIQEALRGQVREDGRQTVLKRFQSAQARHVRERRRVCSRQTILLHRMACEAQQNFSHIDRLQGFAASAPPVRQGTL